MDAEMKSGCPRSTLLSTIFSTPGNQGAYVLHRIEDGIAHFNMLTFWEDLDAVSFYQQVGFERADQTVPMWVYEGYDH